MDARRFAAIAARTAQRRSEAKETRTSGGQLAVESDACAGDLRRDFGAWGMLEERNVADVERNAEMTSPAEPPLNTEALQTVQRRNWTWTIVGVVGAMIVLVGLGWIAGTIMNSFALTPAEQALEDVQQAGDALTATAEGADGAEATLTWSAQLGTAVLTARGLPTPGDDEEIAVWFHVGDSYDRTTSFLPEDGAVMTVLADLWPDGAIVELSVDPVGGSSSGEPVAEPLLSIQP